MSVYRLDEISQALSSTTDEKLIEAFLNSLLTKNEVHDISARWELVKLLDDGMSQRNISKKLGLSLCKITRGSRELKKKNSSFKKLIQKVK
ncbi:MAG: transcriptional regulator [bacterium]|nr:transcriptional regulator [bacterium]